MSRNLNEIVHSWIRLPFDDEAMRYGKNFRDKNDVLLGEGDGWLKGSLITSLISLRSNFPRTRLQGWNFFPFVERKHAIWNVFILLGAPPWIPPPPSAFLKLPCFAFVCSLQSDIVSSFVLHLTVCTCLYAYFFTVFLMKGHWHQIFTNHFQLPLLYRSCLWRFACTDLFWKLVQYIIENSMIQNATFFIKTILKYWSR